MEASSEFIKYISIEHKKKDVDIKPHKYMITSYMTNNKIFAVVLWKDNTKEYIMLKKDKWCVLKYDEFAAVTELYDAVIRENINITTCGNMDDSNTNDGIKALAFIIQDIKSNFKSVALYPQSLYVLTYNKYNVYDMLMSACALMYRDGVIPFYSYMYCVKFKAGTCAPQLFDDDRYHNNNKKMKALSNIDKMKIYDKSIKLKLYSHIENDKKTILSDIIYASIYDITTPVISTTKTDEFILSYVLFCIHVFLGIMCDVKAVNYISVSNEPDSYDIYILHSEMFSYEIKCSDTIPVAEYMNAYDVNNDVDDADSIVELLFKYIDHITVLKKYMITIYEKLSEKKSRIFQYLYALNYLTIFTDKTKINMCYDNITENVIYLMSDKTPILECDFFDKIHKEFKIKKLDKKISNVFSVYRE